MLGYLENINLLANTKFHFGDTRGVETYQIIAIIIALILPVSRKRATIWLNIFTIQYLLPV